MELVEFLRLGDIVWSCGAGNGSVKGSHLKSGFCVCAECIFHEPIEKDQAEVMCNVISDMSVFQEKWSLWDRKRAFRNWKLSGSKAIPPRQG